MPRPLSTLKLRAAAGAVLLALAGCDHFQSADSLVADAKAYQQKGDSKAALIQFKNAAAKSPDDGAIRFLLGSFYNEQGDAVSAEKELRRAISLGKTGEPVTAELLKSLLAQRQYKTALEETAALGDKAGARVLALSGEASLGLHDGDAARAAFERALRIAPNDETALLGMARYWQAQAKFDEAQAAFETVKAAHPGSAEVWLAQGDLHRTRHQLDAALADYDQALKCKPDHRMAHLEKAYTAILARKLDVAASEIAAGNKITPNSLPVFYAQGLLANAQHNYPGAIEALQKVLKLAPEHMPSLVLIGATELNMGNYQSAEQHLKKYVEGQPNELNALKLLAAAQVKLNRPEQAMATLSPALKGGARDAQLLAVAGQAALQMGDFTAAAGYLEQASKLAPNSALMHTALGITRMETGNTETAISELEAGAALDAKSVQAGMALVAAETALKHYDKALAAVAALEKQLPNNPVVLNIKASIFQVRGDLASARANFALALAAQADFYPAVANLAKLDVAENKPADAQKRLEAYLERNKNSVGAMHALSELAIRQDRTADATALLERAAAVDPADAGPSVRLAAQYLATGETQKALTLSRKIQTTHSTNPDVLEMLGQAQVKAGDLSGALDTFSKLVSVNPKSAPAHFRLGMVHVALKNDSAATDDLKRALSVQPDFVQAQAALAEMALRRQQPEQALALARQMQRQLPKSPVGYTLEGDLLILQRKNDAAAHSFEQALTLAKTGTLMVKWHRAMLMAGKEKEASQRLALWQSQYPDEPTLGLYAAQLSIEHKRYESAAGQLETLLRKDPGNAAALNNLAGVYQRLKDRRALPTAEQAYRLASANAEVTDTLGWILVDQGNLERGLPLLKLAESKAPGLVDIQYHLAQALFKSGDKAGARRALESVFASGTPFAEIDDAVVLRKQLQ